MRMSVLACAALVAAPQQVADSFDVVVIHSNRSGSFNTQMDISHPGQFNAVNATARTLLRNAYGLLPFQLASEPGWSDSEAFDIQARLDTPTNITQDQYKVLLQKLLRDRLHLQAHWEDRDSPVYTLVPDKDGAKLSVHTNGPNQGMNTRKTSSSVLMKGTGVAMPELATNLANQLGRYVIDRTGLDGTYDFVLNWSPDQAAESNLPSLFTAIREQAGLRLQPGKGPMPVLVIDHIERPTDN